MTRSESKSSVWLDVTVRVRLPVGTALTAIRVRLNEILWPVLDAEYGNDLKGMDISVNADPSHVLE